MKWTIPAFAIESDRVWSRRKRDHRADAALNSGQARSDGIKRVPSDRASDRDNGLSRHASKKTRLSSWRPPSAVGPNPRR